MKIRFDQTPYNSIRVWMYDNMDIKIIRNSKEFQMFQLLSVWGGFDKQENDNGTWVHSWELPLSLAAYIKDRFKYYSDCEIRIL